MKLKYIALLLILFQVICLNGQISKEMERINADSLQQVFSRLSGTEKIADSVLSFIELIEKKIAYIEGIIKKIQNVLDLITTTFQGPGFYLFEPFLYLLMDFEDSDTGKDCPRDHYN